MKATNWYIHNIITKMASLLTDHNGKKAKNTIVYIGNFKLPGGEAANAYFVFF